MVFGTFDLLHKGHVDFFKQAKSLGDYLVVVVARDSNVLRLKGKVADSSEKQRLLAVKSVSFVDKVVLGSSDIGSYKVILDESPAIIALGYDQDVSENVLKKELYALGLNVDVVRLNPFKPDVYKSSKLKNSC